MKRNSINKIQICLPINVYYTHLTSHLRLDLFASCFFVYLCLTGIEVVLSACILYPVLGAVVSDECTWIVIQILVFFGAWIWEQKDIYIEMSEILNCTLACTPFLPFFSLHPSFRSSFLRFAPPFL